MQFAFVVGLEPVVIKIDLKYVVGVWLVVLHEYLSVPGHLQLLLNKAVDVGDDAFELADEVVLMVALEDAVDDS